jgi:hypothetical protein
MRCAWLASWNTYQATCPPSSFISLVVRSRFVGVSRTARGHACCRNMFSLPFCSPLTTSFVCTRSPSQHMLAPSCLQYTMSRMREKGGVCPWVQVGRVAVVAVWVGGLGQSRTTTLPLSIGDRESDAECLAILVGPRLSPPPTPWVIATVHEKRAWGGCQESASVFAPSVQLLQPGTQGASGAPPSTRAPFVWMTTCGATSTAGTSCEGPDARVLLLLLLLGRLTGTICCRLPCPLPEPQLGRCLAVPQPLHRSPMRFASLCPSHSTVVHVGCAMMCPSHSTVVHVGCAMMCNVRCGARRDQNHGTGGLHLEAPVLPDKYRPGRCVTASRCCSWSSL